MWIEDSFTRSKNCEEFRILTSTDLPFVNSMLSLTYSFLKMSKLSVIASLSEFEILSASKMTSSKFLSSSPLTFLFPRTPWRDLIATSKAEVNLPSAPPLLARRFLTGGKAFIRAFWTFAIIKDSLNFLSVSLSPTLIGKTIEVIFLSYPSIFSLF